MTTLATLADLSEAFLLRSMLEASGIPAFIPDENICQNWVYINALGGVRVQVPDESWEDANTVLAQFKNTSPNGVLDAHSELSEVTVSAGNEQAGKEVEAIARPRPFQGGGLLLVLIALAVVGAFLVTLECGNIQQAAFVAAQNAYDKGDYDSAIAEYSRSIQFGLRNELVYFNRGYVYTARAGKNQAVADYDHAIADYDEAIKLDPEDQHAYFNRGFAYDEIGEFDKAISDYSQAIQLNPEDEYSYCNRGKARWDKGEEDAALADYNQAILLDPNDTQAYFNRGGVYQDKGEDNKAIADYSQVIQIDPNGAKAADAYCNRALSYQSKGEYDKAIMDCNEAIRINPNQKYAYSTLAWLLATSPQANFRDGKRALEAATKGCELTDWKNPDALDTLAAAYAETGDFINAVKWEREYLEFPNQKASDRADAQKRLALYLAHKAYHADK